MGEPKAWFVGGSKGDVYKPLSMISSEGLVVESLKNQPKDTKMTN